MTEAEKLAALDRAAMQGVWFYRPLEHDDWGIIRGEEDDHWGWVSRPIIAQFRGRHDEKELSEHRRAKTDPWKDNPQFVCALVNAYRANQLVLIGPDAVEDVARAIASTSADAWKYLHVSTDPKDWEFEARAALAALGVKP